MRELAGLILGALLASGAWVLADDPPRAPARGEPSAACYGPVLAFTDPAGQVTATAVLGSEGCRRALEAVLAAPIAEGGDE